MLHVGTHYLITSLSLLLRRVVGDLKEENKSVSKVNMSTSVLRFALMCLCLCEGASSRTISHTIPCKICCQRRLPKRFVIFFAEMCRKTVLKGV
jgi:hypothetical protein